MGASSVFPTNVECTLRGARNTSVTYEITVFNNTPYKYAYSGLEYTTGSGYNGNQYIGVRNGLTVTTKDRATDSSGTFNSSDSIEPGEMRTFYATYTIGRNVANTELKTFINYKFGIHVDSMGAYAIDSALQKFTEILNDTSAGGGYETLIDKIDDKYDGVNNWKANYIGNVVDSSSADTETVESLFEGELSLTLNNVQTNVTVLIKREDVDNNPNTGDSYTATHRNGSVTATGCEMTLYMTTDKLQSGSPTIYAAVFTCNKNDDGTYGNWYMIGDLYTGTATIVGYEGGQSTGSFDTGTWVSSAATYTVSSDYSYSVANRSTIQTITQAMDSRANSKLQSLLPTAKKLLDGEYGSYAGQAMDVLQAAFEKAARCYTVDSSGNITVNSNTSRSQLVPLIKELEAALVPFKDIIGS